MLDEENIKLDNMVEDYWGTCKTLEYDDQKWLEQTGNEEQFYDKVDICQQCGWWEYTYNLSANEQYDLICDECME